VSSDGGGKRHDLADRNEVHAEDKLSALSDRDQLTREHDRERGDSSSVTDSQIGADKTNSDQGTRNNRTTQQQPSSAIRP